MQKIQNLEYLFTEDNFDFFIKFSIGFEDKEFALENKMYETFAKKETSTYKEIFDGKMHKENNIIQIWAFDADKQIIAGLYMFVENEYTKPNKPIGDIHLFTKEEYRNMGLSKLAIESLDYEIEKKYSTNKVNLYDDACHFSKHMTLNTPVLNKDIINEKSIQPRKP